MTIEPIRSLSWKERSSLIKAVESVDRFEDIPKHFQKLILQAEKAPVNYER